MSTELSERRTNKSKGFTLIELLIVVAIIAILAAIAVPNFLEAQTRAKVSRIKNDIRTVCVGLESYMVDCNKYPYPRIGDYNTYGAEGIHSCSSMNYIFELSSPIAYLSSVSNLTDPFAPKIAGWYDPNEKWGAFSKREMALQYSNTDPKSGIWGSGRASAAEDPNGKFLSGACISAWGPSRKCDSWPEWGCFELAPYVKPYTMCQFGTQKDPDLRAYTWGTVYDPTNGTMSRGQIFRFLGELSTPAH